MVSVTEKITMFQTREDPNSFRTDERINKKILYQKLSIFFFTAMNFLRDFCFLKLAERILMWLLLPKIQKDWKGGS